MKYDIGVLREISKFKLKTFEQRTFYFTPVIIVIQKKRNLKIRHFKTSFWVTLISFFTLAIHAQDSSIEQLKKAIEELEKTTTHETDTTYINYVNELAFELAFINLDSMILLAKKASRLSKNINYHKGFLQAQNNVGDYCMFTGDQNMALSKHSVAIEEAEKKGFYDTVFRSLNSKAFIFKQQSKYTEAFRSLNKGLRIAQKINDSVFELRFRMNLGVLFAYLNDLEGSLRYFRECLEMEISDSSPRLRAEVLANIGYILFEQGELEESKQNILEAIEIFKKNRNPEWLAYSFQTLASIGLKQKKFDQVEHYIFKSDSILTKMDDLLSEANQELIKGSYMYQLGGLDKAITIIKNAMDMAVELKDYDMQIETEKLLSKIYAENGNYELALFHNNSFTSTLDSIEKNNNKVLFSIERLRSEERLAQQRRVDAFEKKITKQRFFLYLAIFVTMVAVGIALFIRKKNAEQRKTNEKLKEINDAKDKIFSIIGHDLKSPITTLQQLLSLYKNEEVSEKEIAKITPRLKSNVDQSAYTLNNLLVWSKTQMRGMVTKPKPVAIKDHATRVITLYEERINQKKIKVECLTNPKMKVLVDVDHLDLILRNLILNAIKFTQVNGKILFSGKEVGETIVFEIKDSGIGMSKNQIRKILDKGVVTSKLGTTKEKGTGIGLQIVKELLQLNQGSLAFESSMDDGTTAKITLPKAS